jgi:cytochrome c
MVRILGRHAVLSFALVATAAGFAALPARAGGDAAKGADVSKKCVVCHTFEKGGVNKIGPNLFAIVGRAAGTAPGYNYSTAMKDSGLTWTHENLAEYLANPKKKVPGDKMSFAGISNPDQIADLIAYLDTLK